MTIPRSSDGPFGSYPLSIVDPADIALPPTQPIDLSFLMAVPPASAA